MLSYLCAIDITKRTLLIANFSLANEHSITLDRNSAREILSDIASWSSEGSHPSLSFSLGVITDVRENKIQYEVHDIITRASSLVLVSFLTSVKLLGLKRKTNMERKGQARMMLSTTKL